MQDKRGKQRRHSLRLKDYDYAQVGAYFITIVTERRSCLFGKIIDGEMYLNSAGHLVESAWSQLPEHFPDSEPDVFVVMPNHVHGIIHITDRTKIVGAQHAAPLSESHVQPGSLGAIVRSFKSTVSRLYNQKYTKSGLGIWQRNYYEHIVRDETSLLRIREYIVTNPARWSVDPENPTATHRESTDIWRPDHNGISERAQHAAPLHGIRKM